MVPVQVRASSRDDAEWIREVLVEHWGSTRIVSRGKLRHADQLPCFIAVQSSRRLGLTTYLIESDQCEIVSMNSLASGLGVGSLLIDAVKSAAISSRCRRLWLITTNDNTPALRFYQKRGFQLVALHRDAVTQSRNLKPEIPALGCDGIQVRDEIELEILL